VRCAKSSTARYESLPLDFHRRVRTGPLTEGDLRVVQDGVTPDDWIIVNGLQRARPGALVKAVRGRHTLRSSRATRFLFLILVRLQITIKSS